MKTILSFLIAMLFILAISNGEVLCQNNNDVIKYRTKSVTIKIGDGPWSPEQAVSILILIKGGNSITIYSKKQQKFDIVSFKEESYSDEFGEKFRLVCVDQDGTECAMSIYKRNGIPYVLAVGYLDFYYIYDLDADYFLENNK